MIKEIRLSPALAFARVGSSPDLCDNFEWGKKDLSFRGSGRTLLEARHSLRVHPTTGEPSWEPPSATLALRDALGPRKVAPLFQLEASGTDGDGPLTIGRLEGAAGSTKNLSWRVWVANRKAWHFTRSPGDVVQADVTIAGDNHALHALNGIGDGTPESLLPSGKFLSLGQAQVLKPSPRLGDALCLRFTPPNGLVYGPVDLFTKRLAELAATNRALSAALLRLSRGILDSGGDPEALKMLFTELLRLNGRWKNFSLPPKQCILNPLAAWPNWSWPRPSSPLSLATIENAISTFPDAMIEALKNLGNVGDRSELIRFLIPADTSSGNLPPSISAFLVHPERIITGLGLIDDISDGFIEATLDLGPKCKLHARARVVVTPPALVPDRRALVSIADGLEDRTSRQHVRARMVAEPEAYVRPRVEAIMDRAFDTAGLQNADAVLDFFRAENMSNANLARLGQGACKNMVPPPAQTALWDPDRFASVHSLPLTEVAWRMHRRNSTPSIFKSLAQDQPRSLSARIRPPDDTQRYYDQRMPALMRGADRAPLRLTRLQYELFMAWI